MPDADEFRLDRFRGNQCPMRAVHSPVLRTAETAPQPMHDQGQVEPRHGEPDDQSDHGASDHIEGKVYSDVYAADPYQCGEPQQRDMMFLLTEAPGGEDGEGAHGVAGGKREIAGVVSCTDTIKRDKGPGQSR